METDLNSMSKKELERLKSDVEKALATIDERRRAEARKAAEDAAKQHGYNLNDLVNSATGGKKSPPKFRHPEDPKKTWTGRGRQPGWIKAALEQGRSLDEFRI